MAKFKTTNENGEEVEVEAFTPEEVEARIADTKKEYDSKIAEKDTTLSNLTKEKEELQKKLGGEKEDTPNFKALKEALDKKDTDIKELKDDIEKDRNLRKESFINNLISKTSKGNKDIEDKIKFHIDNTLAGMKVENDEDLAKKVDAAIKLSLDINTPGVFDGGIGGGKGEEFKAGGEGSVEFTAREKALGSKLGITSEDYKKYGGRLKNKLNN